MADLDVAQACDGLDLPVRLAGANLEALPWVPMASIAPFRGCAEAIGSVLGAMLPDAGGRVDLGGSDAVLWLALDQWMLAGPRAAVIATELAGLAAVTDQSDGWTALRLSGPDAAAVLARLVPLDLDRVAFPSGRVARSRLGHVLCLLAAEPEGFGLMVMRSFTRTAVHDLETAMVAVAARVVQAGSGEKVGRGCRRMRDRGPRRRPHGCRRGRKAAARRAWSGPAAASDRRYRAAAADTASAGPAVPEPNPGHAGYGANGSVRASVLPAQSGAGHTGCIV